MGRLLPLGPHPVAPSGADGRLLVALGAIAARTTRIRIGPLVAALPRRRPWKVARECTTLDWLSGGRLNPRRRPRSAGGGVRAVRRVVGRARPGREARRGARDPDAGLGGRREPPRAPLHGRGLVPAPSGAAAADPDLGRRLLARTGRPCGAPRAGTARSPAPWRGGGRSAALRDRGGVAACMAFVAGLRDGAPFDRVAWGETSGLARAAAVEHAARLRGRGRDLVDRGDAVGAHPGRRGPRADRAGTPPPARARDGKGRRQLRVGSGPTRSWPPCSSSGSRRSRKQMTNTLLRSGRSGVLNMARDFTCTILTRETACC